MNRAFIYLSIFLNMGKIVYYLSPSSFCFGVKRSIDQLNEIVASHPNEKIFCIHALVHNPKVTKQFEEIWISFAEDMNKVKDHDAIIIFSAHGTNRKIIEEAKWKYKAVYNLECPFVTKIYTEVDNFLQKWISKFLYIGKEHHQEGKNVIEYIRYTWGEVFVCEAQDQLQNIPYAHDEKFAVLSQTTLNFTYVENIINDIVQQFPHAQLPLLSDVCKATYERQTVVVENLDKFETFIVIGGKESNNTKELYRIGTENNKKSFYGESLDDILNYSEEVLFAHDTVAITWGASTPIEDIKAVFEYYKNHGYEAKILEL